MVLAESTKGGYPACTSESAFDEFMQALARKDKNGMQYLLGNNCIVTKGGLQISVLDTTWTGKAKIRVYMDGNGYVMWTNSKNIVR
jgi:hypothetical protein